MQNRINWGTGRTADAVLHQVKRRTYADMSAAFCAELRRLADLAFDKYVANQCTQRLYLCGRKRPDGVWIALDVVTGAEQEAAGGPQIVAVEPVPWSRDVHCLADWMRQKLRTEPLWVFAD